MKTWTLGAAMAAAVLIGCGDKDDGDSGGEAGDPSAGESLYASNCSSCHGPNGGGESETGFTGASDLNVVVPQMSETEIVDVILNGQAGMPPIGVTQAEAEDIAAYCAGTFGT